MELYKYFKSNIAITALETGRVRFTPPSAFNDPFEMKPNFVDLMSPEAMRSLVKDELPGLAISEYPKLPAYIKESVTLEQWKLFATEKTPGIESEVCSMVQQLMPFLRASLEDQLAKIIGAFCLTSSDHNLTMWAHYADSHQGIVLGFDTTHEFFNNRDSKNGRPGHLRRVVYHKTRPTLTFSSATPEDVVLAKGEDWNREDEWRIFAKLSDGFVSGIDGQGIPVHLFEFPRDAITKIILGCRSTNGTLQEIRRLKSSIPSLSRAQLLRATPDRNEYRLNFIPVSFDIPLES